MCLFILNCPVKHCLVLVLMGARVVRILAQCVHHRLIIQCQTHSPEQVATMSMETEFGRTKVHMNCCLRPFYFLYTFCVPQPNSPDQVASASGQPHGFYPETSFSITVGRTQSHVSSRTLKTTDNGGKQQQK